MPQKRVIVGESGSKEVDHGHTKATRREVGPRPKSKLAPFKSDNKRGDPRPKIQICKKFKLARFETGSAKADSCPR
jgi:hypothetical protein